MQRKGSHNSSLVKSVKCAPAELTQASASNANVENVAQLPTVNEPAGSQPMEALEEEQEPNKREPSNSASSA